MANARYSYELAVGPPPIPADEYLRSTDDQYRILLSNDPCEREVQTFLEKHPSIVPGHLTPIGRSGHFPLHCSLIAQPVLPGQDVYIPDFMWIATHSGAWFPTLIEIEKPGKRIFNRDGTPSAHFNKARNQLNQWRSWFDDATNVQSFQALYGIPEGWLNRARQLHMILIYGRRSEFEENAKLTKQRGTLLPGHDEELMSFDRLAADQSMSEAITVKAVGHGRYQALRIPPVFTMGPRLADRLLHIEGVPDAIDRSPEIDLDRRTFLKGRVEYWQTWASTPGFKVVNGGDRE